MKYSIDIIKSNMTRDEVEKLFYQMLNVVGLQEVNKNGGLTDFPCEMKIDGAYYTYNPKKKRMIIRTKSRKMAVLVINQKTTT